MAFDFHIRVSEASTPGRVIRKLAEERQITPQQAAEHLLEEAAQLHTPQRPRRIKPDAEYLQQLERRRAARKEARLLTGDPMAEIRPEGPDALIGYLAGAPSVAQTILKLAYERRASSYGE